ncbi:VirB4 family type IV secretion system protein [Terrisporobacter muris]|uniref:Type IV secretion system DNA-binding domain-containing protein n=1 Tax=Terrisporobacter muris TaxID=2963284 RepID=A0A9X2M9T3_9FIRM|nr:type IV secretion system DNA-binding domain-containing protein [Terrisporobacter muris]MCR1821877.1 type IV secretion system DNA-binding domain-containing protein [Terrisporobacter muris]
MRKDAKCNKKEYNPYLLTEIQPQGGIKFDERIIQKGDGFETIINLYDYPVQVDSFWLERLLTMEDVITTIDIGTANKRDILKKLEKSLVEQENRFYEDRSKVGQIQAKSTYQSLQGLAEDITNNGEIIKMVHIRYFVSAPTREGVESKTKEIIEKLESLGYRGAVLLNEQEYEWKSLFNGYLEQEKFLNKRRGKAIPSETLGGGYPFHYTKLDDPTGMFLGTTFTGGSVLFDLFTKTKDRMSYNAVIVGTMGSGKSTLLKKLVLNNAIQGQTIRVLDIVGEFKSLIHALGGKTISLDGSDGMINPLQILATITDDNTNEVDNKKSFMTHLAKVSMMYKFLNPDSDSDEQRQFESLVSNFYRFKNIDIEKCTEYEVREYPTMSELLKYIQSELYTNIELKIPKDNLTESHRKRLESIILNIESIVRDYGILFDGYSTIKDINKEQIISFELRNLSNFDERIFNAQIFSILTLLWNNSLVQGSKEMKAFNNGLKSTEDCTKYMILIDEAHRIINSNNIKSVEYLTAFEREARKYFGGLIFATQSIRDVAPANINNEAFEKIKTLFELTQYKFIMKQDNNVVSLLSEIFSGQLSENELNKIPYLKQGNCILSINGFDNIMFNVEVTKEELDLFKGGA